MTRTFNIYCDESCHLQNDGYRYMVLGGVRCPNELKSDVFARIRALKVEHGLSNLSEMKWTKVATGKLDAYRGLVNYFFDNSDLSFRALVVDKNQLDHNRFGQNHDEFYYKMYWQMLEWFMGTNCQYHVYLDIKDTLGGEKADKLHEVLANSQHDFNRQIVARIQQVRSHEVPLMQITDILIGAISYANRFPDGGASVAKNTIVDLIRERSGVSLRRSTLLGASKFNLFHWVGAR